MATIFLIFLGIAASILLGVAVIVWVMIFRLLWGDE